MSENVQATAEASAAPEKLLQMMMGYWITQAVYVAAKLGIADLLSEGPVSCVELASKTSTHAPSLRRTLRALASIGVFSEAAPGQFALTPMAALLRKDAPNSVRALAIMYSEEQYRAWGELLYSVRTGQPAFEHQFGMDLRWLLVQANILLSPVSRTAVRASVATSLRLCLPAETPTC